MMASADTVRTCINPRCMGNYDFEHIAHYARKRFVEGSIRWPCCTGSSAAREEEIALVCLLDVRRTSSATFSSAASTPTNAR